MEFKGTKGKWQHHDLAKGNIVCNGRIVANCMGYTNNTDDGEHIQESLSNADLICAAPLMLEALQSCQKFLVELGTSESGMAYGLNMDLIKKALGDK
tara:strand:- start:168 stop:458 length:291 start_codon:yes stop_codon:yes gene_type:complete